MPPSDAVLNFLCGQTILNATFEVYFDYKMVIIIFVHCLFSHNPHVRLIITQKPLLSDRSSNIIKQWLVLAHIRSVRCEPCSDRSADRRRTVRGQSVRSEPAVRKQRTLICGEMMPVSLRSRKFINS
jgi:hypothetical protein